MKPATVYLVGAGPGDPELLTVKALRLLRSADVVVYDRLVSAAVLACVAPGVQRIYAGKARGRHHLIQTEINELLRTLARKGRRVVRLKGGDPFTFGRGSEEAAYLAAHGIGCQVVPGITAASAACYAGIPLTHRGLARRVTMLTGYGRENRLPDIDWRQYADPDATLVIYMGLQSLPEIASGLMVAGLDPDTPAAAVENASTPEQRTCVATLAGLSDAVARDGFVPPAMIIIGRVVSLAGALSGYEFGEATVFPEALHA